ncbi:hypothetical protein [Aquimarina pacifica]|uniref:hypothetical protein n=1 Tax=Aquimarina pacifica TaxID=1296415 RepID=UPI000472F3EB|nr:hypothetical protein [Aquimarina pacifica]
MKTFYIKIALVLCLGVFLSNCEDGKDGMDAEIAINGEDGIDGRDGINGTDGLGFNENLLQYGSITMNLEGTFPDGRILSNNEIFEYGFVSADLITVFEQVDIEEESSIYVATRFENAPNDRIGNSNIGFTLTANHSESAIPFEFSFYIDNYTIITEDLKYFLWSDIFESEDITALNITNYSFNDETNHLIFSYSFSIAPANNKTGNELTVSGEVDVLLRDLIETTNSN